MFQTTPIRCNCCHSKETPFYLKHFIYFDEKHWFCEKCWFQIFKFRKEDIAETIK